MIATVVDYGVGNLFSIARALEAGGAEVRMASSGAEMDAAERLVLPGVGAFAHCMSELRSHGLEDPVRRYAASGRPLLGICVGMQMLFEGSEEFGDHEGLGIVAGRVRAIPPTGSDGAPHKIPHIGWGELELPAGRADWKGSLLEGLAARTAVYFVHSYTAQPSDPAQRLADCHYDGRVISACVAAESVSGCQFHPEKSAAAGLRIVRNFLSQRTA